MCEMISTHVEMKFIKLTKIYLKHCIHYNFYLIYFTFDIPYYNKFKMIKNVICNLTFTAKNI